VNLIVLISLAVLLSGCDQIKWRVDGTPPEPPERANHVPFDTVATITIAGPRDRVERIISFIVERDPHVLTAVKIQKVE
jgi:hypothetical protein